MREHLDPDTPTVHQNGDHSVRARTEAAHSVTKHVTETGGAAGRGESAHLARPVAPERFAVYVDSDETEELLDEELLASGAFDPARILAWGLEDTQQACAYRSGGDTGHSEQFVCESAEHICEMLELELELAGHRPLRVLYL